VDAVGRAPIRSQPDAADSLERPLTNPVRRLYPGYFALVMATGIVSTGTHEIGLRQLSAALMALGLVCFGVLAVVFSWRAAAFGRDMLADLRAPDRAYAFFTFVAACNVLGARLAADGYVGVTAALAAVSLVAWLMLSYGIPVQLILGPRPRPVLVGVNGTWFIWVVGTQSLAVAATVLGTAWPEYARPAALAAVVTWSVGVMLYLIVASLVLVRLLLLEVQPADLTSPYWVTMGATANHRVRGHPPSRGRNRRGAVGVRHLADPDADRVRVLAAHHAAGTAHLPATDVEHRVPARHVRRGKHRNRRDRRAADRRPDRTGLGLGRAERVDRGVRRHAGHAAVRSGCHASRQPTSRSSILNTSNTRAATVTSLSSIKKPPDRRGRRPPVTAAEGEM
jgi:hypothetical protein